MAQKFLFSKSFLLASFLLLFAGSAWAADGETRSINYSADVDGSTIYISSADAWNDFADVLNDGVSEFTIMDNGGTIYKTSDIKTICIGENPQTSWMPSGYAKFNASEVDGLKSIDVLAEDMTLTMLPRWYLTGNTQVEPGEISFWGGLVNTNRGTIKNIRVKDFYVSITTPETNNEGEGNGYWLYYGIICGNNEKGSIEDCEVINTASETPNITLQGSFGNSIYTAAIAAVNAGDNVATIKNCLVKDFFVSSYIPDNPWVYGAQITSVNFTKAYVQNCCSFITNASLIQVYNYPLIGNTGREDEENGWHYTFNYNDISETNRAFILCKDLSQDDNIEAEDSRIIRYNGDGGNNSNSFSDQQGFSNAVVAFCEQENCNFTTIGNNGLINTDEYDYDPENPVYFRERFSISFDATNTMQDGTLGVDLPLSKNNYPIDKYFDEKEQKYKYLVSDVVGFAAMKNLIDNGARIDDAIQSFIIGQISRGEIESETTIYPIEDLIVPSWCCNVNLPQGYTVEGAIRFEPWIGTTIPSQLTVIMEYDGEKKSVLSPIFQTISEGATVKKLMIVAKTEESEFSISADSDNFGFLAGENKGTIDNCMLSVDLEEEMEFHFNNESATNIGCLVGLNSGTISNIINNISTSPFSCSSRTNVNFGGLVGSNSGIVRDVLNGSYSERPLSEEGSNKQLSESVNYGLFVAKNEGENAQIKNVFWAISVIAEVDATVGGVQVFNGDVFNALDENSRFVSTSLTDGLAWIGSLSDVSEIQLIYLVAIPQEYITAFNINIDYNEEFAVSNPEFIKKFTQPAKWCNFDVGSMYEEQEVPASFPFLTFSDMEVDFNEDKSVANIGVADEKEFAQLLSFLQVLPEVYGNANIELTDNIELSNNPMARSFVNSLVLGNAKHPFTGTFNGKNRTISNLAVYGNAGKLEIVENADGNKVHVVTDLSLFGNIGKEAVVKNLNLRDLVFKVQSTNEEVKNQDEFTIPLLAGANKGSMSHVSVSGIMRVDGSGFKDNAKINFSLVGNNDNEINNVSVFIANTGLLYKSVSDLETWFWSESGKLTDSLTFDNAYSYWANAMQVLKHSPKFYKEAVNNDVDLILPTFESFGTWYNQLPSDSLAAVTARIRNMNFIDASDLIHVARNLLGWYHKEAQKDLRAADQKAWDDYANTPSEGNHVAVVATQNLCKSPGKGRTHKVCSAPSGGSSNKVLLLNPYAKDVPETEMECTLDEFASGYAAHWLNYDEKGYSGSYNKMWSQGLLHPIMATDKNKYVVKLEYINEDAEDLGLEYTTYGKVGQTLDLFYTQKPTNVFLDDVELDNTTFAADHLSFVVPETADGKGVVSVHVYFKGTPITDIDADGGISVSALQNRVIISGAERQQITVSNLQGVAVSSHQAQSDNVEISLPKGVYIVKAGNVTKKVLVE